MRGLFSAILAVFVCLAVLTAGAEEVDLASYSYEELIALREAVDARIREIERNEAIANADRRFYFDEDEVTMYVRGTASQRANVERLTDDAPWRTDFTWSSSHPEVATVDETGTVTAAGEGTAVITATATDNPYLSVSYMVHVAVAVERITLWGPDETIAIMDPAEGAMQILGYSIEPEDATCQEISWSSSDETIATVDGNGIVHGLEPGKVTITAVSAENPPANRVPVQASYEVTILQMVTEIEMSSELALNVGETGLLEAAVLPENASSAAVSYTSNNPEIATVDANGTVTAHAPGNCEIACTANDGGGAEARCRVTVSRPVETITLLTESIRLPLGETYTVEVVILPEDATNPELIWTSSNVFTARAANGIIEAVGQGECEITCSAADGSGISATILVRVPTFSVGQEAYEVTEKSGIVIPVKSGKKGTRVRINSESEFFTAAWNENAEIVITPVKAGEGMLLLINPEDEKDTIEIRITIHDSAVFNEVSYPMIPYDELAQKPESYEGQQISLYGKVLQKSADEAGDILLTVGTGGQDYNDQVFQVRCGTEMKAEAPEEGNLATFYGLFRNERVYSEALGSDFSVPGLEAERITAVPGAGNGE